MITARSIGQQIFSWDMKAERLEKTTTTEPVQCSPNSYGNSYGGSTCDESPLFRLQPFLNPEK